MRSKVPQSQRAELKFCFERWRRDQKAALSVSVSQRGAAEILNIAALLHRQASFKTLKRQTALPNHQALLL